MKKAAIILGLVFLAAVVFSFRRVEVPPGRWYRPMLGQPAPEMAIEKWVTPKPDTAGKFVLIDFWATWCPPCVEAIPELNRIQKKFAGQLVVIGLAENTAAQVRAMTSPRIDYAIAADPSARFKNQLEILGIPHLILIDPQGIIRYEGTPAIPGEELTDAKIEKIIKQYGGR